MKSVSIGSCGLRSLLMTAATEFCYWVFGAFPDLSSSFLRMASSRSLIIARKIAFCSGVNWQQMRAFEFVPYVPTAQFILPTAYRTNLSGVIIAPMTLMWNVEKK